MTDLTAGFPQVNSQFVDPETGRITRPWLNILTQLWSRDVEIEQNNELALVALFSED